MAAADSDFLKNLRATFKVEAEEHVGGISAGLIGLERAPTADERKKIVEIIFREAHSLKGAARSVNAAEIEKICQVLESVFAALKGEGVGLSAELFDTLHSAVDELGPLLATLDDERTVHEKRRIRELVRKLQAAIEVEADAPAAGEGPASLSSEDLLTARAEGQGEEKLSAPGRPGGGAVRQVEPAQGEKAGHAKTIRITTAKLDALLLQAEEMLSTKLSARQRAAELRQSGAALAAWRKEWAKAHADARPLRQPAEGDGARNGRRKEDAQLKRLVEFLDRNSAFLKSHEGELAALARAAEEEARALGGMVDNLLADMKKVLMLPAATLLEVFPKVARDLARDQGKEVELVMRGGEVEIDRRILEEVKDPLIHLVRNSVDHGIEKPEERARKGKPPRGTLTLAVTQKSGSEVEIVVADDGAGVDLQEVKAAALRSGVVTKDEFERLDERERRQLIFRSGLSTSPLITDISGRGLGLAIVEERVERLGGALALESVAGAGATFRITLPLTLATFRGILVRAGSEIFVVPTVSVRRVLRLREEEAGTVENRKTIKFDGQLVPLVRLGDALGVPASDAARDSTGHAHVVVLGTAERRTGFLVDEILDEREVLVKSLGRQLSRVPNVAGATVLGTGRLVPILNVSDLLKSAARTDGAATGASASADKVEGERKSILIAEDSLTARTLLKNILESAGYEVTAAADGAAALAELKTGDYDLLVSDVEMPRMDGFELTTKVREDERLSDLPVVLVTSLDSREDRERGVDAGANAYIVKSSFDQSNLLEVIRRMV
jgi:two-component system chemotaxis sensor kinase CheA